MGNQYSNLKYSTFNKDISGNDITESCVLDNECNIINENENEVGVQCNIEDDYYIKKIKMLEDKVYNLESENDKLFNELQRYKIKIGGLTFKLKHTTRRNPFNCEYINKP